MKIAVIDDYQNAFRTLKSYAKLGDHEVVVFTDTETEIGKLAERLKDADAVVLTQQRSNFPRALIERLPKLKLIGQTGRAATHVDLNACTDKGIVVSAGGAGNSSATAELTWGLILSALRNLPFEVKRLKEGHWQSTLASGSGVRRWVFTLTAKSAVSSPPPAKHSAHAWCAGDAKVPADVLRRQGLK
jgi:D-3-phosphoglycerate dehydrogenase / 2-oxoglutarate reductase